MIVYGSTISPYVRKLIAYIAEKGLHADLEFVGGGVSSAGFREASPFGKVPALRDDDGFVLPDSTAIIQYLEAKHPTPALIPADPRARGEVTWFEELADTALMAVANTVFFNRFVSPRLLNRPGNEDAATAAERGDLPRLLDYLETRIDDSGFLVGQALSLADIAVASPFVNFEHVQVAIDRQRYPRTLDYVAGILARPSFAGLIAQERGFIAAKSA